MSIFWDPYHKRPQIWVYPFFVLLTIGLFGLVYMYGSQKADIKASQHVEKERSW